MSEEKLDTSDVDRWLGVPLGGGHLIEPIAKNDIRRWTQGMQNPNPLYFDRDYAAESRFGEIVAPQSFGVCTSDTHGAGPAIQGLIEGSHMLFGGDEWWFYGPIIRPGDKIRLERMLYDYKVRDTSFAGETMFARGDTTYINQRGEVVCKQRSTSIRYVVEWASKRAKFEEGSEFEPEWTDDQIEEIESTRMKYFKDFQALGHKKRLNVKVGDKLLSRPIGPHTVATFTTEWRSFMNAVWGAFEQDGKANSVLESGWLKEMSKDLDAAKIDPAEKDGLYKGPSRGHTQARYAKLIGMPRGYGYGASMCSWLLDYVGNWAGEHGYIVHTKFPYMAPALTGDVTFLDGEVIEVTPGDAEIIAKVRVIMTNQDKKKMADGVATVRLPKE